MSHPTTQPQRRAPLAPSSALDLDDLLGEIRRRAEGVRESQERLAGLLDAVVAISSDLDLTTVLGRIVESACVLVGARYGALGVLDESRHGLAEFVTHGLTPEQEESIGAPPRGHGVLGLVIEEAQTERLARVADHPEAAGFPPGHPPMDSFIGTPVRVRDRVFGNLYLTDRLDGAEFNDDDAAVLEALAAAAGIAVENAQMYRRARGREEWSQVVGELTQTLLEGRNERSALARMVKHAREMGGADVGMLAVRNEEGALVVQAIEHAPGTASCTPGGVLTGARWPILLKARVPLLLMAMPGDQHTGDLLAELAEHLGGPILGATAIVPITVGEVEVGLMSLTWGDSERREAVETMELLTAFAEQMGLAIEAARAQRQRARAALLEDRDRIARDMHDHVIQRLFAAGLSLQAAAKRCDDEGVRGRIEGAADELDHAIKDIRHAIFELHQRLPEGGLGPEIESLVANAATTFGFVPDLAFEGLLADIPPELEQDVVAVVREGLANIMRHARATDAQVRVSTLDDLVITIADNGVGIAPEAGRRGLVNLEERAASHGGAFSVSARVPSGTQLRWRVPL